MCLEKDASAAFLFLLLGYNLARTATLVGDILYKICIACHDDRDYLNRYWANWWRDLRQGCHSWSPG